MNKLVRYSQSFVKNNSATILTTIGGIGVIATGVMAVKATPKAMLLLDGAKEEKGEELTTLQKVVVAAPAYVPTIIMGASTVACIFGANALNKRQQASLMSAYALATRSYKEYREKVTELYGEASDENVRVEVAKDNYEEDDVLDTDGKELFYDEFSKRYFRSTKYDVQRAVYDLNRDLVMQEIVNVNDYYRHLGLPEIKGGDQLGWSSGMNFEAYWQVWIDFSYSKFTLDDGTDCTKIYMFQEPMVDFDEY
jgi:hypothetical protein